MNKSFRKRVMGLKGSVHMLTPQALQLVFLAWLVRFNKRLTDRYQAFLSRRPHRTFRRTRRRDYVRRLQLPGYVAFTYSVNRTLWRHRRTMGLLVVVYAAAIVLLGGLTNQEAYGQISDLMKESSQTLMSGGIDKVGQAGILLLATVSGSNQSLSVDQQIYLGFVVLLVWLTTVWLLREFLLGRKPKLRDGLYNAGAPIVSTAIIVLVLMLQLLPVGIVALAYSGLASVGLATEGFGAMLFWVIAGTIAALILYWITSTLIALVVVTLPGMYPFRALRVSSDLVIGRRLRILYRWLWAALMVVLIWILITVPMILLDGWAKDTWKQLENAPIVPMTIAFMTSLTAVWFAAYVYLLYRKVVDDDAKPA